jgi:hypothetical protein
MDICTTADHNYLHKALALYQSLQLKTQFGDPAIVHILHVLCLDELCYSKLSQANLPGIICYSLPALELSDAQLRKARNNPACSYGDQYSNYCWSLTPWFIHFLLTQAQLSLLVYADADICFYTQPAPYSSPFAQIFSVMGRASVGIHTHRFTAEFETRENPDFPGTTVLDNGWYNVGVMAFRNTPQGIAISEQWKNWALNPTNPFYKDFGTCGDQKYLELFRPIFGQENVCVFDQVPDHEIFHMAPWSAENFRSRHALFYHFSHFRYDLKTGEWWDSLHGEWNPSHNGYIREYFYQPYFELIKNSEKLLHG